MLVVVRKDTASTFVFSMGQHGLLIMAFPLNPVIKASDDFVVTLLNVLSVTEQYAKNKNLLLTRVEIKTKISRQYLYACSVVQLSYLYE